MAEEKVKFFPLPISDDAESKQIYLTGYSRSHPNKICIVASAASGTLVAAIIILTGLLFGMRLGTIAPGSIVSFSYNPDPGTLEEVTSNSISNTVQFHVKNPTYEAWVEDDFNKDIRVLKISAGSRITCYATPLNRTTASDPSQFSTALNPVTVKQNYTYSMHYRAANTPIPDTSFLSKTSGEMCRGFSTYWVYPSSDSPEGLVRRQKRWKFSIAVKWWLCYFAISFES